MESHERSIAKDILVLMRPQQWVKNVFVFLPVFFDGQLFNTARLFPCFVAFIAFCMAASGIYCLNDIFDAEADRLHSDKRKRPIACGAVSRKQALLVSIANISLALIVATICGKGALAVLALYVLINVAYCVRLKQAAIVDVLIIAIGFVLRVIVGGVVSGVYVSHWIILMTFLLTLFIALAKRRDDVVVYEETGRVLRKNIVRYNLAFMNQAISIVASITMVCYIMYTLSEDVANRLHTEHLYVTSLFVLAGIMRYLQITVVDVKSGSPTKVLMKDSFLQLCLILWGLSFVYFIYC